jgi:hypothetical protein
VRGRKSPELVALRVSVEQYERRLRSKRISEHWPRVRVL